MDPFFRARGERAKRETEPGAPEPAAVDVIDLSACGHAQAAVESDKALASSPTLCRLENRADRETSRQIAILIVEKFIASFKEPPSRLLLDFDATDDTVHGLHPG
jgi:hypothetical protein